jgi:hypothetical protein
MMSRFQILNIGDVSTWMNHEMLEDEDGLLTKSILCMPIVNGQKTVIGVAQLINKVTGWHSVRTWGPHRFCPRVVGQCEASFLGSASILSLYKVDICCNVTWLTV